MGKESKPIGKTDEEAKKLIIDVMDGEDSGGFDVDSIYHIDGRGWVVVEFLKCDSVRPHNSHPNRYWHKNEQKFRSLGKLAADLDGQLILVNYEDSREQFRVLEVEEMDREGIQQETDRKMEFDEFQDYFRQLNRDARGV